MRDFVQIHFYTVLYGLMTNNRSMNMLPTGIHCHFITQVIPNISDTTVLLIVYASTVKGCFIKKKYHVEIPKFTLF